MRSWQTVALLTVSLLLGMTSVKAQGLVTQPFPQPYPSVSFQYQRPDFKTSHGIQAFSGAFEIAGSYPITEDMIVSGKLPLGMFSVDDRQEWALGNIGLAVTRGLLADGKTTIAGSLLLSLKTSPSIDDNPCNCSDAEFASYVGWFADPYQAQRFTQRHWMASGNFQVRHVVSPSITLGGELGPQWFIPTGQWGHSSLYFQGGTYVNAGSRMFRGVVEYVAMYWAAGDNPQNPHLYDDMLGFGLEVNTAGPRLTAYYQVMLDSHLREAVNGSYGLKVTVPIGAHDEEDE